MEKLPYQKPYIKKLQAGVMNKFGSGNGMQPVKSIDGLSVKSLTESYGSPLFVLSEKQIRKNSARHIGHSARVTLKCSLPGAIKQITSTPFARYFTRRAAGPRWYPALNIKRP